MNKQEMDMENVPKNEVEKNITDEFWRSDKVNRAFEICGFPYMDPESLKIVGEGKLGSETTGAKIYKAESMRPDGTKMKIIIEKN